MDLIYLHVGYDAALRHLVTRSGFELLEVATSFGDQYPWLEGRATGTSAAIRLPEPPADEVEANLLADGFAELHRKTIAGWADELAEANRTRQHVALWGYKAQGA